jgi:hypothetical protein
MSSVVRPGIEGALAAAVMAAVLAVSAAGCGAAPDADEGTTPIPSGSLSPLEISRPEARLRGIEGAQAIFDITVVVTNPNQATVIMRRVAGDLVVDGHQLARLEIDGEELLEPDSERAFVFDVSIPVAMLATIRAERYVARGMLYADGGEGDGALQTAFELMGDIPPLALR